MGGWEGGGTRLLTGICPGQGGREGVGGSGRGGISGREGISGRQAGRQAGRQGCSGKEGELGS